MPSSNVLIVFYSRCGSTEKLAATAAVGAVQARAAIRLRRIPDADSHAGADGDAGDCQDAMVRMRREYVAPAERDVVWADAIVFAAPDKGGARSGDWKSCLTLLGRLRDQGNLDGKLAVVLNPASPSENRSRAPRPPCRRRSWTWGSSSCRPRLNDLKIVAIRRFIVR